MNVSALKSDFRKAGLNGLLPPWEAPWLADRVARRFGADEDELVAAHRQGSIDRARCAVQRRIDALRNPSDVDAGHAVEWAAKAADLAPEEIVEIVWQLAPEASADEGLEHMLHLAKCALSDFQRVPARRRQARLGVVEESGEIRPAAIKPRPASTDSGWQPPRLEDPAMWPDPANIPPALKGLSFVDFDPSVSTPPPAWLAKGLLPRNGIGLLFGESGAGKSFAAVHAALSVAWGLPLFGAKVDQGAVLYIAAEGGKSVVRRFKAANRELEGAVAAANLACREGAPILSRAPIRIVTEAPDLSRDGDAAPLVRTIQQADAEFEREGYRLALVIIDTWHAALGGAEENSAADAGLALKPLIAEAERGDFLTLIVHHPGKDTDRGARGSNALPAAADAIIAISVPGHEGAKAKPSHAMRRAVVTKMRDGEAGGEFAYRLEVVETGRDSDGDAVTTCVVQPADLPKPNADRLSGNDRTFFEAARAACAEGGGQAPIEEVRSRFNAARPGSKASANRQAWGRALDAAVGAGRVETDEHDLSIWLAGAK